MGRKRRSRSGSRVRRGEEGMGRGGTETKAARLRCEGEAIARQDCTSDGLAAEQSVTGRMRI